MRSFCIKWLSRMAILAAVGCLLLAAPCARGQGFTLRVDENGNGLLNGGAHPGFLQVDTGPGGLPNALTYTLPIAGFVGDLLLQEPGGGYSDLIRFNGNGTLVFYSDLPEAGELPELADIGLPAAGYPNVVTVVETGLFGQPYSEGTNGFVYTPLVGQPGFDPANPNNQPTYIIVSDIPEPATAMMIGCGIVGLLAVIRRRK